MRTMSRTRQGFTLVELLVVIGIIALLISILLPSLSKARSTANKAKCLSNMRQIGLAMVMYTMDNHGYFPAAARWGGSTSYSEEQPADFIYWEQPSAYWLRGTGSGEVSTNTLQQEQDLGALVKYMGNHFTSGVWICPEDDPASHMPLNGAPDMKYPYSYTMNYLLDQSVAAVNGSAASYLGSNCPMKLSNIRHSSNCIMMLEEGPSTINDGCTLIEFIDGNNNPFAAAGLDFAAIRHGTNGHAIHQPDNVYLPAAGDYDNIPNTSGLTSVVCCDGHAEIVSREWVHSPNLRHWDPLH